MTEKRIAVIVGDPALREKVVVAFDAAPPDWRVALFDVPPPDADVIVSDDRRADVVVSPASLDGLVKSISELLRSRCASKVIAVTGATGGAGATTVALHLARSLSLSSAAIYAETDPARRTAAFRLGMRDDARVWSQEDPGFTGLPVAGFRVMTAPPSGDPVDLSERLLGACDVVVQEPDLPAAPSAGVLIVPPTPVGCRRAAERMTSLPDVPWAIVLNRTGPGETLKPAACAEIIGLEPTISLPFSASLRRSELRSCLVTRWSRFSIAIDRLAASLLAA